MHLRDVEIAFEVYEFFEGLAVQGFDLRGICVHHLNFLDYTNIFEIFVPHEIEGTEVHK